MIDIGSAYIGVSIGAAICVLGGGLGIGMIGSASVRSDARQPEESDRIRTLMIISAALIEGLAFFGLVISMVALLTLNANLPEMIKKSGAPTEVQKGP